MPQVTYPIIMMIDAELELRNRILQLGTNFDISDMP